MTDVSSRSLLSRYVPLLAVAAVAAAAIALSGAPRGETCDSISGVDACADLVAPADRSSAPTTAAPLLGGGTTGMDDLAGSVVVVNFWAPWCGPCRAEQPELNRAHETLRAEGVAFLGVALQATEPNIAAHWREYDVAYDTVVDPASAYAAEWGGIGPRAIPTTIVVDDRGRVAARVFEQLEESEVLALVAAVRAEG